MARDAPVGALRRLQHGELVLGSPLPGHVRDDSGRVLIRKGQRLTDLHLQLLQERQAHGVYADETWAPPSTIEDLDIPMASPDELVHALQRRSGARKFAGRYRRHHRHAWQARMRLTLEQRSKGLVFRREMSVTTRDISASGFSFLCRQYVHLDTLVYARFEALPGRPLMKAVVRNCEYVSPQMHRVGAEFIDLQPSDIAPRD